MDNKTQLLEELKKKMKNDALLPLKKEATNLVFGEGCANCEVMCIGEGPGFWEDQKGRPFVGNAGAFLNQLLAAAGFKREDVFITNVVHYRPPENRDPLPEEISAFSVYLNKMIDIIDPRAVVTLGRFSMGKFLPNARITGVHGKKFIVDWQGKDIIVVPMYHPAAGLRNPGVKEQTIEDFKKLPEILKESQSKITESAKEKVEQMNLI
jgi:uracil-DNA glycosylase